MLTALESEPFTHPLQSAVLHQNEYALGWQAQLRAVFRREVLLSHKFWALFFTLFALSQVRRLLDRHAS